MTDTGTSGAPAAPAGEPQAGNAAPPAGAAAAATTTAATDTTTPDDGAGGEQPVTLEEARRLRSENQGLRKRLKPLEDAKVQADEASLSEVQRLTKRNSELEAENATLKGAQQAQALERAAAAAARKLGFRNPDIAHRLLDTSALSLDDEGRPKNIDQLLGEVARQNPYLVNGATDFGGGSRGAPAAASNNDMNTAIRRAAGRT